MRLRITSLRSVERDVAVFTSSSVGPICDDGLLHEHVNGVDDPREITANGEQKADPEFDFAAKLEEYSQRRQNDGQNNVDECHGTHFLAAGIEEERSSRSDGRTQKWKNSDCKLLFSSFLFTPLHFTSLHFCSDPSVLSAQLLGLYTCCADPDIPVRPAHDVPDCTPDPREFTVGVEWREERARWPEQQ